MYYYNICMKTPIGVRIGTMHLSSLAGVLDGKLSVLNHMVPISGEADVYGNCRLSGSLITLMQTIPFTAKGKISRHAVSLQLCSDQGEFELNGVEAAMSTECAIS